MHKSPLQHRLPQLPAAPEAGVDGGFDLIENGVAALDLGDNPLLDIEWRDSEIKSSQFL